MDFKSKLESIISDWDVANLFFCEDFDPRSDDFDDDAREVISQYTIRVEDMFGGEGCGDNYWVVYKFEPVNGDPAFYIKFDGWYQSYNGSEYDDWFYVEPKEVTVTQYFPVK